MAPTPDTLCPGCFEAPAVVGACPRCRYDAGDERPPSALPPGTLLNDQFVVGRVLGKPGGFGITYLAFDRHLEATVALKEYLPRDLALRAGDGLTVIPQGTEEGELFRYGLGQFLTEARTLAKLDHPNIVRVRQFFEARGSAYLVMDYYRGLSLAEYLLGQPDRRLPEAKALALMQPVLDGLRSVHAEGFLHRDIKPQNIYLARLKGGGVRPILLDFGAARQAMADRSRSISVVISPGYAPFEQYHRRGQQGPASDIYSAAAVLYRMVTGETPPEATERMAGVTFKHAAAFGVSLPVSVAITNAMAMDPGTRPQSVEAFQETLVSTMAVTRGLPQSPSPVAAPSPQAPAPAAPDKPAREQPEPQFYRPIGPSAKPPHSQPPPPPAPVRRASIEPEMVRIPAGSFLMGSPEDEPGGLVSRLWRGPRGSKAGEPGRSANEGPQHLVQVPDFELGRTPVTFAQWDACVADGGCKHRPDDQGWGRSDRPVINVSWHDAQEFLAWLSRKTGKTHRLPSEAEWEYAARAGTTTAFSTGDCIHTDQANYNGTFDHNNCGAKTGVYLGKTQSVGSYPANPWGLLDMHGNVYEWTEDCWNDSYAGAPTDGSAVRHGNCSKRVVRGGSWFFYPGDLRSANRNWSGTGYRDVNLGFRVARTITP